jgi:hypothetical protein
MSGRLVNPAIAIALVRSRLTGAELEIFERSDPECRGLARRSNDFRRAAAPTAPAPRPSRRATGAGATLGALRGRAARLRRGAQTARGLKERARRLAPGPDVTVPSCASASGVRLNAAGVRRAAHAIGVRERIVVTWAAAPSLDGGRAAASHRWEGERHGIQLAGDLDAGQVDRALKHELQHAYQSSHDPEHVSAYHADPAPYEREAEEVARSFPDFGVAR